MPYQHIQNLFSAGELDPLLRARTDKEFYGAGCRTMLNFLPAPQGGVTRRPGTRFLGNAMSASGRLIPFVFSASQGRILEFGDYKMRVWMPDGTYVTSGGNVYEVETPYPQSVLRKLRFAQSADVMYFVHPNYKPRKLVRNDDDDWEFSIPTFEPSITPPTISYVVMTGTSESTVADRTYSYKVVSVSDEDGTESNASTAKSCTGKLLTSSYHPRIMWEGVDGAAYYKVYKYQGGVYGFIGRCTSQTEQVTGMKANGTAATLKDLSMLKEDNTYKVSGGGYGWVSSGALIVFCATDSKWYRIASPHSGYKGDYSSGDVTEMTGVGSDPACPVGTFSSVTYAAVKTTLYAFDDENIAADTSDLPLTYKNPFNGTGKYPSQVFFFQQRLGFAGTKKKPLTFWLSRSGEFENFATAVPPTEDDSIEVSLAAQQAAAIAWCRPDRDCLVFGTESAEWTLQPSSGGVLTPKNCSFRPQSSIGSENLDAVGMTDSMVYLQRASKAVRAFAYQYTQDKYTGQDLTIVSRHLLKDVSIVAWAYQQEPYSILWCVTSDRKLLGLTVMPDQSVAGWHRHETDGQFRDVVSIPGTPDDQVWFITYRNSQAMIERLETFFRSDELSDAFFADSAAVYDGPATDYFDTGLAHLAGRTVTVFADGSTYEGLTVSNAGRLDLPVAVKHAVVGRPYTSTLVPNMAEVMNNQINSLMHNRTILHARFRVINSMTFNAGVDALHPVIDRMSSTASGVTTFPIVPFYSEATDLDCVIGSGWKSDYPLTVQVSTPTPLTILAILLAMDVAQYSGRAK